MKIDGHAHACGVYLTVESIEKYLNEHQIDKVVLCGGEPNSSTDYAYPMLSKVFKGEQLGYFFNKIICTVTRLHHLSNYLEEQNKRIYELACKLPNRILTTYWANPLEEDCIEKLKTFYATYGFKMLKLHQCWTKFDIGHPHYLEIVKWASSEHMPIFIHLLSREQIEQFVKIANEYPSVTFIVAHMIGIEYMSKELRSKQVYFDLSAPQLYSVEMMQIARKVFGAQRLVLGSDTPYGKDNIEKVCRRLEQLELSEEEKDLITGGNLKQLLGV